MRLVILQLLVSVSTLTANGQTVYSQGGKCPETEERLHRDMQLSNTQMMGMIEDVKQSMYKASSDIYKKLYTLQSKGKSVFYPFVLTSRALNFCRKHKFSFAEDKDFSKQT
jgi:hypothetical protein